LFQGIQAVGNAHAKKMSYLFFKKGLKKRCYWCSEDDRKELTDDHLPPDSIFPKEDREGLQLITVTLCKKCETLHHMSGDDNNFLRHMHLWASMRSGSDISRNLEECVKYSSFTKGEKIVQAEYLPVELSNGKIVQYPILKGGKEGILRVLDSIARGFYYRMKGEVIPEDVSPDFEFRPKGSYNPPINILTRMPPNVVKKHVFEFETNIYRKDTFRFLCWEFKFYNLDPLPIYYSYDINEQ
jgi:hypothetical protein